LIISIGFLVTAEREIAVRTIRPPPSPYDPSTLNKSLAYLSCSHQFSKNYSTFRLIFIHDALAVLEIQEITLKI
jgi:hypothetical protein